MSVAPIRSRNAVESLRDVVQDLLVPELKAVKASVDALKEEVKLRDEKQTQAIAQLGNEMKLRDEKQGQTIAQLGIELKLRDEHLRREMQMQNDRLFERQSTALDLRARIASLEARRFSESA